MLCILTELRNFWHSVFISCLENFPTLLFMFFIPSHISNDYWFSNELFYCASNMPSSFLLLCTNCNIHINYFQQMNYEIVYFMEYPRPFCVPSLYVFGLHRGSCHLIYILYLVCLFFPSPLTLSSF